MTYVDSCRPIRNNDRLMDSFPLRPREVFEGLSKTVVGQDEAIRELSVAIVKHLVGHPAPNSFWPAGRS
jgi:ATP-dependent protease Clp ATPase subunit